MVFVEWANGAASPYSIKFDVVASSSLAPNAPTNLFVSETALTAQSGYSDPVSVGDSTPVFSSIYSHDTTDDVTSKYQIVVYSDEACTTPVWNSGDSGTTIANCTQGNRCADVELSGDPIPLDGSQYYFKMKYWDSNSCGGVFSDCTANFTMASPETQMRHGANFFNNEVKGGFGW
jgi:hypothetical protein